MLFETEFLVVRGELLQDFASLPVHLPLIGKDVLGSDTAMRADRVLPTQRVSTTGTFSPTALAKVIQRSSLATNPGKRSGSGLMMWEPGVFPRGREICSSRTTSGSLSWAPASERRTPSSPAMSGQRGSSATILRSSASLSLRNRRRGFLHEALKGLVDIGEHPGEDKLCLIRAGSGDCGKRQSGGPK